MFTRCAPGMGAKPRFKRVLRDDDVECPSCGDDMPLARQQAGYPSCCACSTEAPKTCNMPMHKQAYGYTHNPDNLRENCYSTHK